LFVDFNDGFPVFFERFDLFLTRILNRVELFELQNVREHEASHVRVIRSFMVVGEGGFTHIVAEAVLLIVLKPKIVFEFVVLTAFLVLVAKRSLVESHRLECKHFRVESKWESIVPIFDKLSVGRWQRSHKLVIEVDPVVHWVLTNQRFLCLYHLIDDKRKAELFPVLFQWGLFSTFIQVLIDWGPR